MTLFDELVNDWQPWTYCRNIATGCNERNEQVKNSLLSYRTVISKMN